MTGVYTVVVVSVDVRKAVGKCRVPVVTPHQQVVTMQRVAMKRPYAV